jgi:hypothetical protein
VSPDIDGRGQGMEAALDTALAGKAARAAWCDRSGRVESGDFEQPSPGATSR